MSPKFLFAGGGGIHTLNGNMETIADIEDFNRHNTGTVTYL